MSRIFGKGPRILFAVLHNPFTPIALAATMSLTVIGASLYLSLFAGRSLLPGPLITQLAQQIPAPVAVFQLPAPGAAATDDEAGSSLSAADAGEGSGATAPPQARKSGSQPADHTATAGMRLPEHGSIEVFAVNKTAKDVTADKGQLYSSSQTGSGQAGGPEYDAAHQPSQGAGNAAEGNEGKADPHHGNREGDKKAGPASGSPGRPVAGKCQAGDGNRSPGAVRAASRKKS